MHEFTRTARPLLDVVRALPWLLGTATWACAGKHGDIVERRDASESISAASLASAAEVSKARVLASGREDLPPRPEALALAESIEAQAVREGSGARAASLHIVAARVVERIWRVEGRDRDALEALDMYRAAALMVDAPPACEAALAGARLAGDAAHDASVTFAELYRAQRRLSPVHEGAPTVPVSPEETTHGCRRDVEDRLARLGAFRPPQRVLDAIDADLAGEGTRPIAASSLESASSKPPQILRVESWPGPDAARVVVVLDRPAAYRIDDEIATEGAAGRTLLELDGVDLGGSEQDTRSRGIMTRVRAGSTTTGSRVWIDLDGRVWRRAFVMRDPYRIVVDVTHHPPGANVRSERAVTRVVLDPGHGGKDNGAVGSSGLREKDVTLDIARRAAPILSAKGVQVVLTRDDDRFVALEERTARANAFGADLFISIHCNASESRTRRGFEAYVLDTSRDEIATRVAARENATTPAATAELGAILGDLRLADQSQRSTRFAQLVDRAAASAIEGRYADGVDGGVHTAGFYVLVGADMPGTLIETSYISNTKDEQRLATGEYRQLLADAIANALKAYREGR